MKQLLSSMLLSTFLILVVSPAIGEPAEQMTSICNNLQKITKFAADEALTRPDKNIFKTEYYTSVSLRMYKDTYKDMLNEVLTIAQVVLDENGTSDRASDTVRAACMKIH
jgi:hypothetical protein